MSPQERAKLVQQVNDLHAEVMDLVRAAVRDKADIELELASYVRVYSRVVTEIAKEDE